MSAKSAFIDRSLLLQLHKNGELSESAYHEAFELLQPRRDWGLWSFILLVGVGAGLVLSGIIFFFAFNWQDIPSFWKLGLIEIALIACAGGAWATGLDSLSGRWLAFFANGFLGVFMAVFGQIYQTGADAWQLFAVWSVLGLVWVLLSRWWPHWLLWLVVSNLALMLWVEQELLTSNRDQVLTLQILAIFNGLLLILRELWLAKMEAPDEKSWLAARPARWIPALLAMGNMGLILGFWIFESHVTLLTPAFATLMALAGLALSYGYYRFVDFDRPMIALLSMIVSLLILAAIMRWLGEVRMSASVTFLFGGFIALGLFSLAANHIRNLKAPASKAKEKEQGS
ncbi:MAG: DUF2157 domain-containing protein [Cohaesibacter sp.]|nr:DUF2157 domain-containing protein [Cohaesibacter sp.]